jgi:TniQ
MDAVRTLPIRLRPVTGEALDSWLEGLARRTHSAFGDLLSAVGVDPYRGKGSNSWIVQLTDEEAERISLATGVAVGVLETMTLAHYFERALRIEGDPPMLSRTFPWGPVRGSRFCPTCLKDTGGRWQLSWRLGWAFACTKHRCLLADACPECGVVQRRRTHVVDLVSKAGVCAHSLTNAIGRSPAQCGADLTAALVTVFDADHPVVHAQRVVNAVIDGETASFGAYQISPQLRINILSDLRAVAGRVLAYATREELEAVIPDDLRAAHFDATRHQVCRSGISGTDTKPGLAAPARAAATALGVITALRALEKSDIAEAGDELRWLVTSSRARGSHVYPTNTGWGKGISPVLAGIQLAALGPVRALAVVSRKASRGPLRPKMTRLWDEFSMSKFETPCIAAGHN